MTMHIIHVKILENMRNFKDHSIIDDYTTFVLTFFFTITIKRKLPAKIHSIWL